MPIVIIASSVNDVVFLLFSYCACQTVFRNSPTLQPTANGMKMVNQTQKVGSKLVRV